MKYSTWFFWWISFKKSLNKKRTEKKGVQEKILNRIPDFGENKQWKNKAVVIKTAVGTNPMTTKKTSSTSFEVYTNNPIVPTSNNQRKPVYKILLW